MTGCGKEIKKDGHVSTYKCGEPYLCSSCQSKVKEIEDIKGIPLRTYKTQLEEAEKIGYNKASAEWRGRIQKAVKLVKSERLPISPLSMSAYRAGAQAVKVALLGRETDSR